MCTEIWYNNFRKEVLFMSDIERIVKEVDSSMAMEGMPLTNEDKNRIEVCLNNPGELNKIISNLLKKHTVS